MNEEFHQSNRTTAQHGVESTSPLGANAALGIANNKVIYNSDDGSKISPGPREGHTRATTLPPQFMLGSESTQGATVSGSESSDEPTTRLNITLSPSLRQNNSSSVPLNIAVPGNRSNASVEDSPMLVPSPALTYNSSASSAALSPATPFFGSFGTSDGGFGGEGVFRGKTDAKNVNSHNVEYNVNAGLEQINTVQDI